MKRYRTLFAVLLTILSLAFIVFVAIMQQNFTNPTFADLPSPQTRAETADNEIEQNEESDTVAGAAGSVVNDNRTDDEAEEEEEDTEETEITYSTRTVLAETLNARSGPSLDYDLVGYLVEGQVVEVEDNGEEWVKVITDEFVGFVNKNYLSEE